MICSCTLAEAIGLLSYLLAEHLIGIFSDSAESVAHGTQHMRTICLFYFLLAFSHCIAGVLRGAGKATVPMFIMLSCWCVFRMTYIFTALRFVNVLTTVSWAYPITWTLSGVPFLLYYLLADWPHYLDRKAAQQV